MCYTLFGTRGSGSAAIEMALRTAGIDYCIRRASEWEADSAIDELRRINPLGQVPTLVLPGGEVLTESAAILIHLGLEHPGHDLLPRTSAARAMALRGLVYIAANCYGAVSVCDYPARWTTAVGKAAHARVRSAARAQLHRAWEIFADQFGAELARAEASPGALAFLTVVVSRWSGARQHLMAQRPAFSALLQTLEGHARVAPVLQEHAAA